MARLDGTISITGLPPHRGLIVYVCVFPVTGPDAPVPHAGDPPAKVATDCDKVIEQVDLERESQETTFEQPFGIERSPGYYYVQIRVTLFRNRNGRTFAQVEQFFFARRPVHIAKDAEGIITFPVSWPVEPLEALHHYETVVPKTKRPWWRIW